MTGRRPGGRALLLAGVLTLTGPAPAARAEHAAAFRYTVLGYATLFAHTLERFLAP